MPQAWWCQGGCSCPSTCSLIMITAVVTLTPPPPRIPLGQQPSKRRHGGQHQRYKTCTQQGAAHCGDTAAIAAGPTLTPACWAWARTSATSSRWTAGTELFSPPVALFDTCHQLPPPTCLLRVWEGNCAKVRVRATLLRGQQRGRQLKLRKGPLHPRRAHPMQGRVHHGRRPGIGCRAPVVEILPKCQEIAVCHLMEGVGHKAVPAGCHGCWVDGPEAQVGLDGRCDAGIVWGDDLQAAAGEGKSMGLWQLMSGSSRPARDPHHT